MKEKVKIPFLYVNPNGRINRIYNSGTSFYIKKSGKWHRLSNNRLYHTMPVETMRPVGTLHNLRRIRAEAAEMNQMVMNGLYNSPRRGKKIPNFNLW